MKIRNKINLSFFIIFSITLLVMGVVFNSYSGNLIKRDAYSYLDSSNRARAEHIRTYIKEKETTALIMGDSAVYRDLLNEPVGSAQYKISKEKVNKRLKGLLLADQDIHQALILDKKGKVIAASEILEEGVDKSQDEIFTESQKRVHFKSVYYSEVLKDFAYAVSAPILSPDGLLLGVSVLRYSASDFYQVVASENGLGDTEENFLINKEKFFITPSRFLGSEVILKQKVDTQNAANCFDPKEIEYVKKNGYGGVERVENHGHIVESKDYRGVNITGTHAYIPETEWCLITKVDTAQLLSYRLNLGIIILLISLVALFTLVFVGFILARGITQPISLLSSLAKKIKKGDFELKTNIKSNDEIGELANSFDLMIEAVRESKTDIEKKVEEQTKELIQKTKELNDQKTAVLNILEDVRAEKENFEQVSRKLSLATRSAQIGVWEWDVVKNVITWDDQMYKIYGLKKGDFGGAYEAWQAGLHPDDKKPGDEAIQQALRGEKEFSPIFRVIWPSGEIRYVQAYALVERDATQKPLKMIGVNFDVTHEKEVDKAKTEFVSLASHQLRTPLSAINWYTEMLLNGDAGDINEEQKKYLQEVSNGNQRMVDLVNALLNVSRLDLGTFMIEPVPTDVRTMARSVLDELRPQIEEKKIKIDELYDPTIPPEFLADQKLLRIIFQNLLSNAVKYTLSGGQVSLRVTPLLTGKTFGGRELKENSLTVAVADSGMGIPNGQKDKIFEKLFRADNARESETEGTGLGLYIVKSIIGQSGGDIWFESLENKGTTFYLTLPLSGMKKKEGSKKLD